MEKLLAYFNEKRGRRSRLAESLGISLSSISTWQQVPMARIVEISKLTGIPPGELRPDLMTILKGEE